MILDLSADPLKNVRINGSVLTDGVLFAGRDVVPDKTAIPSAAPRH